MTFVSSVNAQAGRSMSNIFKVHIYLDSGQIITVENLTSFKKTSTGYTWEQNPVGKNKVIILTFKPEHVVAVTYEQT